MTLHYLLYATFISNLAINTVATKMSPRDVVFSDGFEFGNLDQWSYQACPDGVTISSDISRSGGHSAKFTVSDGDTHSRCGDVPTDNPRAQIVSNEGLFGDGDEYYIGFSTYFPKGFPQPTNFFQIAEFYGPPFGGSPTMGIDICHGNRICFERDASHGYDNIWESSEIVGDEWRDLQFHICFSTDDENGFVEVYDDGQIQTLSNGDDRIYYKTLNPDVNWNGTPNSFFLNQYRSSQDSLGTVIIYHDAAKVGNSLDEVMP